jgi:hypothetical protein
MVNAVVMEGLLQTLSRSGTSLTKFYPKKRPDRKLFSIRLDTGQIIWSNQGGGKVKLVEGLGKKKFEDLPNRKFGFFPKNYFIFFGEKM